MKLILPTLLLSTLSLFAMHPLSDYTECQQPYVKALRQGDADAFKKSFVECRANLWNEDMTSYTSYNYKKFSATTLTCAGNIQATELMRGRSEHLKYTATYYRLAAQKGDSAAKKNLVALSNAGYDVIFTDDTKKSYTQHFHNDNSLTFLQIMMLVPTVKKEDRDAFMKKHLTAMRGDTQSCISALKSDISLIKDEQNQLLEINEELYSQTYDKDGNLVTAKADKSQEASLNIWLNVEDRLLRSQKNILESTLKKYQSILKHMDK